MRKFLGRIASIMVLVFLFTPAAAFAGSLDYEIVEGADQVIAYGEPLVVTAGGEYGELDHVEIDSEVLDDKSCTVDEDTMEVTVAAVYLAGLDEGEHDLTIVYEDGTGSTTFTIEASGDEDAAEEEADDETAAEEADTEEGEADDAADEDADAGDDEADAEDGDDEGGVSASTIAAVVVVAACVVIEIVRHVRK